MVRNEHPDSNNLVRLHVQVITGVRTFYENQVKLTKNNTKFALLNTLFKKKTQYKSYLSIYAALLLFLVVLWQVGKKSELSIYHLVADPAEIAGLSPLSGILSQAGIFAWCATATVCFFVGALCRHKQVPSVRRSSRFLLLSGTMTLLLMLDDAFQLHETAAFFLDRQLLTGITVESFGGMIEAVIFLVYACLLISLIILFYSLILRTNFLILFLSLMMFCLSIIIDIATPETMKGHYLLEEGFKFLGVASWLLYYWEVGKAAILRLIQSQNNG